MASVRTPVVSGITEFGNVESGPTDVPWGATERNGVTIAITGEDVDVQSGQNLMLEDSFASARTIEITARLQYSGLLNLKDALGIPDADLTGDLQATPTATDEVLSIKGTNIGTEEQAIYALTPGPVSTRRYESQRAKQRSGMTLELGSVNYVMLESVWQVLAPPSGDALTITDAST